MNKTEFVTSLTDVDCLKCWAYTYTYTYFHYWSILQLLLHIALVSKILKSITKIPKSNDCITLLCLSDLQFSLVLHKTKKRSPVNIAHCYWNYTQTINWLHKKLLIIFLLIYQKIFVALYYCSSHVFVMSELCCLFKKLWFIETFKHSCILIW